jgi:hypothetical protein
MRLIPHNYNWGGRKAVSPHKIPTISGQNYAKLMKKMEVSKHLKDRNSTLENINMHQKQSFKSKVDQFRQNVSYDMK